MPVVAAGAAAAAASANNASHAARIAREKKECRLFMEGFSADNATVGEMRTFAKCVDRVYPAPAQPITAEAKAILQGVVIFLLIVYAAKAMHGTYVRYVTVNSNYYWRRFDAESWGTILFVNPIMYAMAALIAVFVLFFLYIGIEFLFF